MGNTLIAKIKDPYAGKAYCENGKQIEIPIFVNPTAKIDYSKHKYETEPTFF